ncbi:MAG: tetratricopeptide repeat protein [Polyangiaceae bacterium]
MGLAGVAGCSGEPELVGEHVARGDQALSEGQYSRALSAYAHAHELSPQSARVQRAQMWARVVVMVDEPSRFAAEILDDVAYEAELLQKLAAGDKAREAMCVAAIGNVRARRGDVDGAKEKLDEAVQIDPSSATVRAALGFVLLGRGDGDGARAAFDKALEMDAGCARALIGLGQIQLGKGDHAGAAERFLSALRKREDVGARMGLGNALLQQGKHAEAAQAFERVVRVDGRNADALSSMGQALLGAGKLGEAEQALRAAIGMRADEGTAIALGYALARLKKSEEAAAVFGQVLSHNPEAAAALYGTGIANEDLGRTGAAREAYTRLLAVPATGAQGAMVSGLQKEARDRLAVLASAGDANGPTGATAASGGDAGAAGAGAGAAGAGAGAAGAGAGAQGGGKAGGAGAQGGGR